MKDAHLKFAVSGSTGLVGREISRWLKHKGYVVSRLVRPESENPASDPLIHWDVAAHEMEMPALEGHDVVIHLAGANISGERWTPAYKEIIRQSRVKGTRLLSESLAKLARKPKLLVCASAVGYYGNRDPGEMCDEHTDKGKGFLSDVCAQWEEAARPAKDAGIRVAHMRLGVVLSSQGGALAKMLPPFRFGLGGPLGDGRQMMSWIALEEIPAIISFLVQHDDLTGAVNVTSPQPVSNAVFTRALGRALNRPAFLPVPAFAVRAMFGEMGDELLLGGANVVPHRLLKAGYHFKFPDLETALRRSLAARA